MKEMNVCECCEETTETGLFYFEEWDKEFWVCDQCFNEYLKSQREHTEF